MFRHSHSHFEEDVGIGNWQLHRLRNICRQSRYRVDSVILKLAFTLTALLAYEAD